MSVTETGAGVTLQEAGRLTKVPGIGKKNAEAPVCWNCATGCRRRWPVGAQESALAIRRTTPSRTS